MNISPFFCLHSVCGNCRWPCFWLWEAVYLQWCQTQAPNSGQPLCAGDTGHRQRPGNTHYSGCLFVVWLTWKCEIPGDTEDKLTVARSRLSNSILFMSVRKFHLALGTKIHLVIFQQLQYYRYCWIWFSVVSECIQFYDFNNNAKYWRVSLCLFQEFQKRLSNAKRIVVVGNGGIALELVWVNYCQNTETKMCHFYFNWNVCFSNCRAFDLYETPSYNITSLLRGYSHCQCCHTCSVKVWGGGLWGDLGCEGQSHRKHLLWPRSSTIPHPIAGGQQTRKACSLQENSLYHRGTGTWRVPDLHSW